MPEGKAVQSMFSGIASRYDLANHLLSGGLDLLWRRKLVKLVQSIEPETVYDLATGSGDVAFALANAIPSAQISGLDFCEPMLDEARMKQEERKILNKVSFTFGDILELPLKDESADAITMAFGLRNLENRDKGLKEILRILKPGGTFFVLEFTQPQKWFSPFYYIYLKGFLPILARLATGNKSAYEYLAGSIEAFPKAERISSELEAAGFTEGVRYHSLSASIVAIHIAQKPA